MVALDPDTGALKWHFQFTPNDTYDYDSVQIAVLADIPWPGPPGTPTKASCGPTATASSTCSTGRPARFAGAPFVKVNWASGLDANGRPVPTPSPRAANLARQPGRHQLVLAVVQPAHRAFYLSAWEGYASIFRKEPATYIPGRNFLGGGHTPVTPVPGAPGHRIRRYSPVNDWTDAAGHGSVIALDPHTLQRKWTFDQ